MRSTILILLFAALLSPAAAPATMQKKKPRRLWIGVGLVVAAVAVAWLTARGVEILPQPWHGGGDAGHYRLGLRPQERHHRQRRHARWFQRWGV